MAAVVLRAGAQLNHAALLDFCQPRMPYFAVPRFVEFVDALPVTENGKVTNVKTPRARRYCRDLGPGQSRLQSRSHGGVERRGNAMMPLHAQPGQ